ncbi:MAG: ThuA domain-containing protein [Verrucomicrobiota bacterium]
MKKLLPLAFALASLGLLVFKLQPARADHHAENPASNKPLKCLLVTGGCCHDYKVQQHIISAGVSERIPTDWTIFYEMDQEKSKAYLSAPGWAEGYDVIVYNHCFAKETDAKFIESVAAVHDTGLPAIALHCAIHSYHWNIPEVEGKEKAWPALLGVSSKGHGPKAPITVNKVPDQADHPVLAAMPDGWTTPEGELYNVQRVLDTATVLAYGDNGSDVRPEEPQACIWVNDYNGTRIMATTIGHHNSTMSTDEYLDLLANGIRWVTEK